MSERHRGNRMNVFYASAQNFQTFESILTGKQIKEIANISPGYPLFQDNFGNGPDSPIGDGVAVNIAESVKHFYAPPPATMYRGCE